MVSLELGITPPLPFQVKLAEIGPAVLKIRRGGGYSPHENGSKNGTKSDPKVVPFRGGRMRENTMKTKGFGSKSALRGVTFWSVFGPKTDPFSGPNRTLSVMHPAGWIENPMGGLLGGGGYFQFR